MVADLYQQARNLVKALRESEQSRQMRRLAARVERNGKWEKLLAQFRTCQLEIQAAHLQGKAPPQEQVQRLEQLAKSIEAEGPLREYMMAETAYGQLLVEIQQILAEAFDPEIPGQLQPRSSR